MVSYRRNRVFLHLRILIVFHCFITRTEVSLASAYLGLILDYNRLTCACHCFTLIVIAISWLLFGLFIILSWWSFFLNPTSSIREYGFHASIRSWNSIFYHFALRNLVFLLPALIMEFDFSLPTIYWNLKFLLPAHIVEFGVLTGLSYGFPLFHHC